jgi:hypothetical protein
MFPCRIVTPRAARALTTARQSATVAFMMMTRVIACSLLAVVLLSAGAESQVGLRDLLRRVPAAGVSEAEAGRGVKEALAQGVDRAVRNLHRTDGFFGSNLYKMWLPPDARKAEGTLRRIGLGGQVDRAILAINRGAEDAVGAAGPIFLDTITAMTIADALGIVRGERDAATRYFRHKTSQPLIAAFTPSVEASLKKTHATRYYGDLATAYNRNPFASEPIDADLTAYVVGKTVDALFDQIAREEAEIRANPVARTTDLLKRVFGGR